MARDSLTAFHHKERDDCVISIYKGKFGSYVNTDYVLTFELFYLERDEEEVDIGPKCIVSW